MYIRFLQIFDTDTQSIKTNGKVKQEIKQKYS